MRALSQEWLTPALLSLAAGLQAPERSGQPTSFGTAAEFELRFEPRPGTRLLRTFHSETRQDRDSMEQRWDGTIVLRERMRLLSLAFDREQEFVVLDLIEGVREQRPVRLVRTFRRLMGREERDDDRGSARLACESLLGRSVAFEWNAEQGRYDRSFLDPQVQNPVPPALAEDMDFRGWLPNEPVSIGDSWEIPLGALESAWVPGGIELLSRDEEPWSFESELIANGWLPGESEPRRRGTLRATLEAVHSCGQEPLAVVGLSCAAEVNVRSSPAVVQILSGLDELTPQVDVRLDGSGSMLWNLERHHLLSLELRGSTATRAGGLWRRENEHFNLEFRFSGSFQISVRVEPD